jgi:hypothetical protein
MSSWRSSAAERLPMGSAIAPAHARSERGAKITARDRGYSSEFVFSHRPRTFGPRWPSATTLPARANRCASSSRASCATTSKRAAKWGAECDPPPGTSGEVVLALTTGSSSFSAARSCRSRTHRRSVCPFGSGSVATARVRAPVGRVFRVHQHPSLAARAPARAPSRAPCPPVPRRRVSPRRLPNRSW